MRVSTPFDMFQFINTFPKSILDRWLCTSTQERILRSWEELEHIEDWV